MNAAKKTTPAAATKDGKHPAAKLIVPKGPAVQGVQQAEIAGKDAKSKSLASLMYPTMSPGPGAR